MGFCNIATYIVYIDKNVYSIRITKVYIEK